MPAATQQYQVKWSAEQLALLRADIAQMGGLAEQQLSRAIEAIGRRDTGLAERLIEDDAQIDKLEIAVDARAVRLLSAGRPSAPDLRQVLSALKISSDLERVGDLAKNIAKRAMVLNQEEPLRTIQSLTRMGRLALNELKDALDAYSRSDTDQALAVWRRDEALDELYNSLLRELLTFMMNDPRVIGLGTHLMFVAKNLERIGDHATNVAETVYYLVNGDYLSDQRPKGDFSNLTTASGEVSEAK